MNKDYYSRAEAAARLGVSGPTITNLTRSGELTPVVIPSGFKRFRCFYPKEAIEKLLKAKKEKAYREMLENQNDEYNYGHDVPSKN